MIACYHYSNFEWLSLACGFLDLKGTIISQEFKNPSLDRFFKKTAGAIRSRTLPRESWDHAALTRFFGEKAAQRYCRSHCAAESRCCAINCFGLKTSIIRRMHGCNERTGVPIVPAHCEPLANGRYRLVFHQKIANNRRDDSSGNRAGMLEFRLSRTYAKIRRRGSGCTILALPSSESRPALPVLCKLLSAFREHACCQQICDERLSEVVGGCYRQRTPVVNSMLQNVAEFLQKMLLYWIEFRVAMRCACHLPK